MFLSLFNRAARKTSHSRRRSVRPQLETLESRNLLNSKNPVAGESWMEDVYFHGHFDGAAAHLPKAEDFKVIYHWGDGSSSQAQLVQELAPQSDNFVAYASHTYAKPGPTKNPLVVEFTNMRDQRYHWFEQQAAVNVNEPPSSLLLALSEAIKDGAHHVEDVANESHLAVVAQVIDTANAIGNVVKGGIGLAMKAGEAAGALKNVSRTLAGNTTATAAVGKALQAVGQESTALGKAETHQGPGLPAMVSSIVKVNALANGHNPIPGSVNPDGKPLFPYVLGVPQSAIKEGAIVLGKWSTWPEGLTEAVEAQKGITASSISQPPTLKSVFQQWGPQATIPPYVEKLYASGSPISDGAGAGIYLLEMGVANGRQVIFDVSNVNIDLVKAQADNALAFAKEIHPRAQWRSGNGQPANPALYEMSKTMIDQFNKITKLRREVAPLTEKELIHVLNNPKTFKGKIQFFQNMKPVSWDQLFGG
jgi:hypothetical protein